MTRLDAWDELAAENADLRAQLQAAQEEMVGKAWYDEALAEIERLRGALREFASWDTQNDYPAYGDTVRNLALRALTPEGTPPSHPCWCSHGPHAAPEGTVVYESKCFPAPEGTQG